MIKIKKRYQLAILLVILIGVSFIIFKVAEYNSSKPEKYNLADLESEATELIQNYGKVHSLSGELLSCHVFTQDNQVFAFFDYKPLKGDSLTPDEMSADVIERCLFFGYAKIEKRFNNYHIADFQTSMYDTKVDLPSVSGNHISRNDRLYCYGKILDDNIDKIEFYNNNVLIGTYYVGDKDYYFIILDNSNIIGNVPGKINHKFYDKENHLLGEL